MNGPDDFCQYQMTTNAPIGGGLSSLGHDPAYSCRNLQKKFAHKYLCKIYCFIMAIWLFAPFKAKFAHNCFVHLDFKI
jgi:hypothetical protein